MSRHPHHPHHHHQRQQQHRVAAAGWKGMKAASGGRVPVRVVSPPRSIIENASRNETLVVTASIIYNHRMQSSSLISTISSCCLPGPPSSCLTSSHHQLIGLASDSCRALLIRRSLQNDRSIIIDPKLVIIAASHSTRAGLIAPTCSTAQLPV